MWLILTASGLLVIGWPCWLAYRVLFPEHRQIPSPESVPLHTPHAVPLRDSTVVNVWVLPATDPRGRVLLCHGYYADRYQVLEIAEGLRQRGYESVLFELRGHGSRPGPCTLGVKEASDALAILEWAAGRDRIRSIPVAVLGLSMGAAVVCQVAARSPSVKAVVTDSPYSRLFPVLKQALRQRSRLPSVPFAWLMWWAIQWRLGARLSRRDPVALAPRLHQPLLAIQGGEDRRVAPSLGEEFYQQWAGPKERWFEATIAHVGMFPAHPQEYCARVAGFLDRVFA